MPGTLQEGQKGAGEQPTRMFTICSNPQIFKNSRGGGKIYFQVWENFRPPRKQGGLGGARPLNSKIKKFPWYPNMTISLVHIQNRHRHIYIYIYIDIYGGVYFVFVLRICSYWAPRFFFFWSWGACQYRGNHKRGGAAEGRATSFVLAANVRATSFVVAASDRHVCILAVNKVNVVVVTTILVLHVGVIGRHVSRH